MLQTSIIILSVVAAVHCSPGQPLNTSSKDKGVKQQRLGVYGGTAAKIEDHPYRVSVTNAGDVWCQGVIVSESWVLTVPGCIDPVSPEKIGIVAGSQDGEKGTKYKVADMFVNPNSGKINFDQQWALIQVKGGFKLNEKVQIVSLPKAKAEANVNMTVAGWGNTSNSEGRSLMAGYMDWMLSKQCKSYYQPYITKWTKSMACAYNKGRTTLCNDDWGAGLVNDGVLYGTFVAGLNDGMCTGEAAPVLVADVYQGLPWIKSVIGE